MAYPPGSNPQMTHLGEMDPRQRPATGKIPRQLKRELAKIQPSTTAAPEP